MVKRSRQWAEWHLTPRGWELGSTRLEPSGTQWKTEPEDRVLTLVYTETRTNPEAAPATSLDQSWCSKTAQELDPLLQQFGPCPQRLS
jgi:hypothetical protein